MPKFRKSIVYFCILLSTTSCVLRDSYTDSPSANFEMLWKIMDENYCFFDYKEIDWDEIYNRYRAEINEHMDEYSLFWTLSNMLEELKDGHVNLIWGNITSSYSGWYLDYPSNYSEYLVAQYIGFDYYTVPEAPSIKIHTLLDNKVGYLYYGSFTESISERDLNYIIDLFIEKNCVGVIIDVRGNGGGSLTNSDRLASRFLDKKTLCGYIQHKTGKGRNDFSAPYPMYLSPSASLNRNLWLKPVIVVADRSTFSAANNFVSKMGVLPNVTTLGAYTGGGSGLPFNSELPNGWSVRFSTSPILDINKQHTEFGIAPHIEVEQTEEDEKNGVDTLLKAAIKELTGIEYEPEKEKIP